mmetsp:Transcript_8167/g.5827  ORF Transcript_8167/g.5827 Transcript_8167/m.5827 type:complete len:84 (+) Transcript_8167:1295-1546(+)
MYPNNITVVSKISQEIVYSRNFDEKTLRGLQLDLELNKLLLFCPKGPIMIAHMQGEDADAWKYYLKKGMIKEAMNDCSANNKK